MAPSAIAEHAVAEVQNKVVVPKPIERIPLPKLEAKGKARPLEDHGEIQPAFPFSKAVLLDENRFKSGSRALRLAVSILLHVTVITVPILIGLFFTDTINIKQYAAAMLVAPPPPPPPPATGGVSLGAAARPPVFHKAPRAHPPLARQARIEGQVQIDAVLDENGSVVEMKVVSGPALLYQAALEALKKWKYEPTYLNDQPIAVQLIVTVTFVLSQ